MPGLFCLGEANFSDHGANRLGASALMQGLADGYFVLPYTIGNYFASEKPPSFRPTPANSPAEQEVNERMNKLLSIRGKRTVTSFHRELGQLVWDKCGMARNEAGLKEALKKIPELRQEFWENVNVTGENGELNQNLEYAGRTADFLEFAEVLCNDALAREESCGGHFREEYQFTKRSRGEERLDRRGRGQTPRRQIRLRGRLGIQGRRQETEIAQRASQVREVKMSTRSYK